MTLDEDVRRSAGGGAADAEGWGGMPGGTVLNGRRRHPGDVVDPVSGKVRVLSRRCETCIFRPGNRMRLRPGRFEEVVRRNVAAGALLTCHDTLPYGDYPEFGPAVCAGFWARHGLRTAAGRIAKFALGVIRVAPPGGAR